MKQVGNALKAKNKFWRNNEIITVCGIKVYYYKMTMNEKFCYRKQLKRIEIQRDHYVRKIIREKTYVCDQVIRG